MLRQRWVAWVGLSCALACSGASVAAPALYPPLRPAWSFAAQGGFYSPPAVAEGRLFIGGVDGHVYALDAAGKQLWKQSLGGQVYAGVVSDPPLLYAASTAKVVVALDAASGEVRWRTPVDGVIYAAPRRVGELVVVGTGDTGSVYGLAAATGEVRWRFPLGARLGSGIEAADGLVFLPSYDRHLYAVEAATGLLRWQFVADGPVDSMPLADGDRLYFKLANDAVYALERATGKLVWKHDGAAGAIGDEPTNWSPLRVANGQVLYGSIDGRLHALAAATGQPAWSSDPAVERPAPPAPAGELGFAGGKDGCLEAVDLASGQTLWNWQPEQPVKPALLSGIMWPPAIHETRLYAASLDGHLYAFEGLTDKAAWEASRKAAAAAVPAPASGGWPANLPAMSGQDTRASRAEIDAVTALGRRVKGFVVWESNRDGAWELYRIETDGSQFRRLTNFSVKRSPLAYDGYLRPRVSPDGQTILFAYGRRGAPVESWVLPAAGGQATKVADGSPLNWLPDGSGFYLVKDSKVLEHSLADGGAKPLNGIDVPVTGRDGGMVGCVRPDRKAAVFRAPGKNEYFDFGQRKTTRTMGGCEPQFTVDGKFMFWVNGPKDFRVIDLQTDKEQRFLGQPPNEPHNYTYFPTVSADQRWVAYGASPSQHDHNTSDYEIFLQELRDWQTVGAPVRLSWHPKTDRWPFLWVER